eukprot:scaffold3713_cov55-Phaeocystis_antarctica.AAC.2
MRIGEGACGAGPATTARRRRAVRARRWQRRRGGRLAGALAVDHVLDVHDAALVRVRIDIRGCLRYEGVRAIHTHGQRYHLGTLKEGVDGRPSRWAALAVHLYAVDRRADHVLVLAVVVGVPDRHTVAVVAARVAPTAVAVEMVAPRAEGASSRLAVRAPAAAAAQTVARVARATAE